VCVGSTVILSYCVPSILICDTLVAGGTHPVPLCPKTQKSRKTKFSKSEGTTLQIQRESQVTVARTVTAPISVFPFLSFVLGGVVIVCLVYFEWHTHEYPREGVQ
jgi:hypothetical protein